MSQPVNTKHIKNTTWYRQGGAISLFYVLGPYSCINETIGFDGCILCQEGEVNTAFFDRKREEKKARWVLEQQIKNRKFIDSWIQDWEKKVRTLLNYCNSIFQTPINKWSDKKLVVFLNKFQKLTVIHWKKGVLLEWTDPDGLFLLHELIKRYNVDLSEEEINILISPEKLTFNQSEFIDRIKLVEQKLRGQDIGSLLVKHTKKYFWHQNTWAYVYNCDEQYFAKKITADVENIDKYRQEVKNTKKYLADIKLKKAKILKNKKVPTELKNVFYMFTKMVDWRDYRKKMSVCLPNYFLYKIIERLMKENGIKYSEFVIGGG
ncbi:MAG: hypothetical protein WCT11_01860 [Candidatus Magasanikbacteria bacterium]